MNFLTDMRLTFLFSGYPTTVGSVGGWTADGNLASAGYQRPIFSGSYTGRSSPALATRQRTPSSTSTTS